MNIFNEFTQVFSVFTKDKIITNLLANTLYQFQYEIYFDYYLHISN